MADLKVSLTIRAVDAMSGPMRRMVSQTRALGARMRDLGRRFKEVSSGAVSVAANLRQAGEGVDRVGRAMRSALAAPIKMSEDFGQKMTEVRAIMGLTAGDPAFKKLEAEAERLGFTLGEFTMQQAAEGMKIMAMAGRGADDVLKGLPVTLNLSTAAGLDFAETTDIMLGIMGGFNLTAEDTARVADVLSATFTGSKVDLQKLGETFKYAAATGGTAGLAVEDLALVAGLLGNASIDASVAGTTMTQMMMKLLAQTPETAEALERLGVEAATAAGTLKTPVQVMSELGAAMKDMTDVEIAKNLKEIFGLRGFKGAAKVMKALGTKDFEKLADAIKNSAGRTNELAAVMRDTAKNETLQMESAIQALQKTLGDELAPELKKAKRSVIDMTLDIVRFTKKNPEFTKTILVGAAAVAALTTALSGLLFTLASVSALVGVITAVGTALGGVVIAVTAVSGAFVLMTYHSDQTESALLSLLDTFGIVEGKALAVATAIKTVWDITPLGAFSNAIKNLRAEGYEITPEDLVSAATGVGALGSAEKLYEKGAEDIIRKRREFFREHRFVPPPPEAEGMVRRPFFRPDPSRLPTYERITPIEHRAQQTNVGGRLDINITSDPLMSVDRLESIGPMDLEVNTGFATMGY